MKLKKFDDAEALYRKSLSINRAAAGDDNHATLDDLLSLIQLLCDHGRRAEAQPFLDLCAEIAPRKLAEPNSFDANWFTKYATTLARIGLADECSELLERAAPAAEARLPESDPNRQHLMRALAGARSRPSTIPVR